MLLLALEASPANLRYTEKVMPRKLRTEFDLREPPSRRKGIMIGLAIAAPLTLLFFGIVLPYFYSMIVGGAASLDQRVAVEGAYMQRLCSEAMVLERDETLCKCALASELPGIDCRPHFDAWTFARQQEQCADASTKDKALSFCTCVLTLAEQHQAAQSPGEKAQIIGRYHKCAQLEDALFLPEIESLPRAKSVP